MVAVVCLIVVQLVPVMTRKTASIRLRVMIDSHHTHTVMADSMQLHAPETADDLRLPMNEILWVLREERHLPTDHSSEKQTRWTTML